MNHRVLEEESYKVVILERQYSPNPIREENMMYGVFCLHSMVLDWQKEAQKM